MRVTVRNLDFGLWKTRNFLFLLGVFAMSYTLMRPSPVDLIFLATVAMCLVVNQPMRLNFIVFLIFLVLFEFSFFFASIPYLHETNILLEGDTPNNGSVPFEILAKTFVVIIGLLSCYVSSTWKESNYNTLIKVYIASAVVAAILGSAGFFLKSELLTWDDRAKGLIDDPNMYGAFLIPAVLGCVHLLHQRIGNRLLLIGALPILTLGIILSFSRAASVALVLCLGGYLVFLNRFSLGKLFAILFGAAVLAVILVGIATLVSPEFSEKLLQRSTVAESYDLGREGRYARYLLVLPMILDNPIGLGIMQLQKIFPEPIHNMYLSSFINYGWLGGFTWLTLFVSSMVLSIENYRRTRSPIAIFLMFSYLSQAMGIALHEGEHWRHLWLYMGLLWGFSPANFARPVVAQAPAISSNGNTWHVSGLARAGPGQRGQVSLEDDIEELRRLARAGRADEAADDGAHMPAIMRAGAARSGGMR